MSRLTGHYNCEASNKILEALGIDNLSTEDTQIVKCENELCSETCKRVENCEECPINEAIKKLADYEDAEEQGFLFRFPCKIGDTVFFHWHCSDGTILVFPAEVKQINIGTFMLRKSIQYKIEPKGSPGMLKIFYHTDFGFSIFTTKEAAEAALKKMQEGE